MVGKSSGWFKAQRLYSSGIHLLRVFFNVLLQCFFCNLPSSHTGSILMYLQPPVIIWMRTSEHACVSVLLWYVKWRRLRLGDLWPRIALNIVWSTLLVRVVKYNCFVHQLPLLCVRVCVCVFVYVLHLLLDLLIIHCEYFYWLLDASLNRLKWSRTIIFPWFYLKKSCSSFLSNLELNCRYGMPIVNWGRESCSMC